MFLLKGGLLSSPYAISDCDAVVSNSLVFSLRCLKGREKVKAFER